jgi:hypothetical protein
MIWTFSPVRQTPALSVQGRLVSKISLLINILTLLLSNDN